MYTLKVTIKGKERIARFGSFVIHNLIKSGVEYDKIGEEFQRDPIATMWVLLDLALKNGSKNKDEGVSLNDFYDWADANGGIFGESCMAIFTKFTESVGDLAKSLPQSKKKGEGKPKS